MSTYDKRNEFIKKYFESIKVNQNLFQNLTLKTQNEYIKSLYFRMLCVLAQYTGNVNEMQTLYLKRLMDGCKAELDYIEYMRMAMSLNIKDIDGFVLGFKEDDLRYYFCIDGCILLVLGDGNEKKYELLVKCAEILKINPQKLQSLALLSKAIILQDSEMINCVKQQSVELIERLCLYPYIANFYTGLIENNESKFHLYSCCNKKVNLSLNPKITAKTVIIENIFYKLETNIIFENCESVIIRNANISLKDFCLIFNNIRTVSLERCTFERGKKNAIAFHNCLDVQITNCQFLNFSCRTIIEEKVHSLTMQNSKFKNCMYEYTHNHSDWSSFACVIYTSDPDANGRNILQHCSFINCGGKNLNTSKSSDILSNCISRLINCTFTNCWHYNYYGLDPDNRDRKMFRWDTEVENCHVINSARIN